MFSHVVRIYSLVVIIYSHAVRIVMDAVIECFIPWINLFCTPRREGLFPFPGIDIKYLSLRYLSSQRWPYIATHFSRTPQRYQAEYREPSIFRRVLYNVCKMLSFGM